GERQRLVQSQAEHEPPRPTHGLRKEVQPTRPPPARAGRRPGDPPSRRRPPAAPPHRRGRADSEARGNAPAPAGEVVARAQVAAANVEAGEVRRLVPAVARSDESLDHALEVALHRLRLATELVTVRVCEAGAGLRLELVTREMLGPKRERLRYVGVESGGLLPRDPVDEIQGDVVKTGIAEMGERAPDVVRSGNAIEDAEQLRWERRPAEGDSVDTATAQQGGELRCHRLRVRLDRQLRRRRQGREQTLELTRLRESRGAAAEEDGLQLRRECLPLELELHEQCIDVGRVLTGAPDDRDEVAVAAPAPAEGEVDVDVPDRARAGHRRLPSSRLRTARNASCGISTAP